MNPSVKGFRRTLAGAQPPLAHDPYRSTLARAPMHAPVLMPATLSEATGPVFAPPQDGIGADLTRARGGEPLGERIIVGGRVIDENGRPLPHTMIEIWQCNAAGRYNHPNDRHDAPLDPYFGGCGRVFTDAQGYYRFKTIKPGAYPWRNHYNAWRPAHIHYSLFGPSFGTRLVTQMYFPGDPLLENDPIFNSVPDAAARRRLVSQFDWEHAQSEHALGYRFDFVLRGTRQTPWE